MFRKILIANRGEIACRVARTARRLGIKTVAVYSEADQDALHVVMADQAVAIGPAPARESYLDIEKILAAARKTGAEAIHPGYGFLSENADFAEACENAGLVFIGPPASAIRAMGDKAAAKALMQQAGVSVVPGYHGAEQSVERLASEAERVGYPVLIKASAGGGGKGMRIVERAADLSAALASARREAESAFGNGRLLIEKYLIRPRHIEVQVFADTHGHVLHLFERDCSIQRRYQKVIEEAPAIDLAPERRAALHKAAVAAARTVRYRGAGTVEFIVAGDLFAFMEMNTRLQVEHPVTEAMTGLDLVEWQIRVAAGEGLPLTQEQVEARGHAIEARLYAEDPVRDFLPATGPIAVWMPPTETEDLRIDTGIRQGDDITIHYDPMIAKLIVRGRDRDTAVRRLGQALADLRIAGLATNREFLYRIATHPAYAAGELDTGFIERHRSALIPPPASAPIEALVAASLDRILDPLPQSVQPISGDPWSPWRRRDGWRLNGATYQDLRWRDGEVERSVRLHYRHGACRIELDGRSVDVRARREQGRLVFALDGGETRAAILRERDEVVVMLDGLEYRLRHIDPTMPTSAVDETAGRLTAPMPGRVVEVKVTAGASVTRGTPLMVLEAMKMEHTILAPTDGLIERVNCAPGDLVAEGAELIVFVVEDKGGGDASSR